MNAIEHQARSLLHRFRSHVERRRALKAPLLSFVLKEESQGGPGDSANFTRLLYPTGSVTQNTAILQSCLCSASQLNSAAFRYWAQKLELPWRYHRKLWEFCFICQALYERGMLEAGRKGLGFAVGEEPLPALFASHVCSIVATDLEATDRRAQVWADTAQLAVSVDKLERANICEPTLFRERVSFRPVDMNRIPADLADFDFTWSSCSFEHCGSLQLGLDFVVNQMQCLRPGGIAVHTTEFNLNSNDNTLSEGGTVIFRKRDIDSLVHRLKQNGHHVEPIAYALGSSRADKYIDTFPYAEAPHLKLVLAERFVSTSIALIIRKSE